MKGKIVSIILVILTCLSVRSSATIVFDSAVVDMNISVMSYNLLNFPNGRDDCGFSTKIPARWDTLAKITDYYGPDVVMVCELQDVIGANMILSNALNVNGDTSYAAATFVENQSTTFTGLNNMLFYNQDKLKLHNQSEILTSTRDFNKYTLYVNDANLSLGADTVFLDFYMVHLKSGSASASSTRRAADCAIFRAYLDSMPARNTILGGDLNLYTSSEQAYQTLISGLHPLSDPLNMPGSWNNNASFSSIHSQSTRPSGGPSYDCGATGGMDSRFDFILLSNDILNGDQNCQYADSSYTALGNNGSTFNGAINDTTNTSSVPANILDALYFMSDHLPVVMNLQISLPLIPLVKDLIVSGQLICDKSYNANDMLRSNAIVNDSAYVVYQADSCIQLIDGFEVTLGSTFETVLSGTN